MDRLKHSKATVAANIKARAATRLELPETAESAAKYAPPPSATAVPAAATAPSETPREALAADAEPTSYTARLLAAKERARQEQQRPD